VDALDPPTRFNGLENFVQILHNSIIRTSRINTLFYVGVGVVLSTVLGIAIAALLQRTFPGRSIVLAVLILPWALPGVVEGILWSSIFDPNGGLIAGVMSSLHLGDAGQVLLGQNRLLTVGLIELVQVWQITPLSVLLILATLQLIPADLYEAARIDGCNTWQSFLRVTLPLARAGIAVAMVEALIATINVFDQPYVLNGAATTGSSINEQVYFISFQNLDFGQGYALSLMITIVTVVAAIIVIRTVYRRVEL
jgi:multiple sugar transport system permease protein